MRGGFVSKHIVVIDDCKVVLAMASDYLAAAGFRVSTADNGVYSNHLIYSNTPPDLILLDLVMPLMSGEKKLKLLKSRKKSRNIPVLLISSKEERELQAIGAACGADGCLAKPFTASQLVLSVQSMLAA
ncbi:MAG TPA: two-component system response regulator [Geobacter sp.]|nr:two-component system response regulator [Geobacter sp.]